MLWALPLLAAPPLSSQDLRAYAGQAALVAAGRDPWTVGPRALSRTLTAARALWLAWPTVRPPVAPLR